MEHDTTRAIKCYTKALAINPTSELSAKSLVSIWIKQNILHQATTLLKSFTAAVPRAAWAWRQLGILSLSKRRGSEAIPQLQASLRINVKDSTAWASLGEAYTLEGKYMAALKALDRSLELEQGSHGYYLKATVYQKLGMFSESVDSFRRVFSLAKDKHASSALLPLWIKAAKMMQRQMELAVCPSTR
jgi:superkiller protein 3